MFMIAIKSKHFFDSEFAASPAAKQWVVKNGWATFRSSSEGKLRKIASTVWWEYGLESRVFEI